MMREVTWTCPKCSSTHVATVGDVYQRTLRTQLRMRLSTHLSQEHRNLGVGERSRLADRMVAELLGRLAPTP